MRNAFSSLNKLVLLGLCCAAMYSTACSSSKPALEVQVVTGLVPGPEFASVLTEVFPGTGLTAGSISPLRVPASFGQPFAGGYAVARFSDLPNGVYTIWVHLYRPNGQLLIERRMQINVNGSYVLRVHLTRDCLPSVITCPEAGGSSEYTECLNGRCVDPRCNPADASTHEFCPAVTFCNGDSECTQAVSSCAMNKCVGGICTPTQVAGTCVTQWCDPDPSSSGCSPLEESDAGSMDASLDAGDAGVDGASLDAGEDGGAMDATFDSGCVDGVECVVPSSCELATFNCSLGMCEIIGAHEYYPAGTECDEGHVCASGGDCVACPQGATCSLDECTNGQVDCSTGVATCVRCLPGGTCVTAGAAPAGTACRLDGTACVESCDEAAVCADLSESDTLRGHRTCAVPGTACTANCLNGTVAGNGLCVQEAGNFADLGVGCGDGFGMVCDGAGNCVSEF